MNIPRRYWEHRVSADVRSSPCSLSIRLAEQQCNRCRCRSLLAGRDVCGHGRAGVTEQPVYSVVDDDLDNFDWEQVAETPDVPVEEDEDPLGDFLAQMNK